MLNSSLNVAQFWDGRAADLKEQAGGPIANPGEMAFSHTLAIGMLESIPEYVVEPYKGAEGMEGRAAVCRQDPTARSLQVGEELGRAALS